MKSRILAGVGIAALAAAALTGCAGGSGDSGASNEITFMFRGNDAEKEAYTAAIKQFE